MKNEYDKWADEYLESARLTQEKINEYQEKRKKVRRNTTLIMHYTRKIRILQDMYSDCMQSADELRRKAIHYRERQGVS